MSTARELQSPCCAAWLTSLSDSKLGKSSLITVSYQHSNRCEVRPANNNPPIIAIIETKTGNILISLDHWRIAGGNCGLIHQENKYWQITQPWAAIRDCPIPLNGPKLLFDHKLCLLELELGLEDTRAGGEEIIGAAPGTSIQSTTQVEAH